MRQRPLEDILATARLPRQSAIDALFGGPTVTKTPTVETTSLVAHAVVFGHDPQPATQHETETTQP